VAAQHEEDGSRLRPAGWLVEPAPARACQCRPQTPHLCLHCDGGARHQRQLARAAVAWDSPHDPISRAKFKKPECRRLHARAFASRPACATWSPASVVMSRIAGQRPPLLVPCPHKKAEAGGRLVHERQPAWCTVALRADAVRTPPLPRGPH
jgi:hypothetical protein